MTENANTVPFDANADPAVADSAVLTSTEFTPVDAGSDVTITYDETGSASMEETNVPELKQADQNDTDSGFSAAVRRGVSFIKGFVPEDVNQRFDNFRSEQSNSMKSWKTFFGLPNLKSSYSFAWPKYIPPRFMANLKSYLWNYVALIGITFALISLFNFPFFIVALALIAVWLYVYFWRSGPMVVFSRTLPHKFVTIGLIIISVLLCWLVLGNEFWIAVLCDVIVCLLHAVLRNADVETVDFH